MDTDREAGEESEEGDDGWMSPGDKAETNLCTNRCQHFQDWETIMEESEGLAYDDPHCSSDATIMGVDSPPGPPLSSRDKSADSPPNTPGGLACHLLGSPM